MTSLPATIRERMNRERRWVAWRIDMRGGQPTKVPVNPTTGELAKSNDPATWGSLVEAENAFLQFVLDGVGFMLGDGWAGIDIDGPAEWKTSPPKDDTEAYERRKETYERTIRGAPVGEWIARIGGYSEFSPNNGVKIIVPDFFQKEADQHKNEAGLEFYSGTRFFVVTGATLLDAEVDLDAFRDLAACRPPRRSQSTTTSPASTTNGTTPYGAAALRSTVAELLHAPEGDRNNCLNRSAFSLGQLVPGELDEGEARRELTHAALSAGLEMDEIRPTLDRALKGGMAEPRSAPGRIYRIQAHRRSRCERRSPSDGAPEARLGRARALSRPQHRGGGSVPC
jgi:hypothetical protein